MNAVVVTWDSLRDASGLIIAVAGALAVLGRWVVRPAVRWAHRVERALTTVEHEFYPNSGKSMRDQLNRIESQLGIGPPSD